MQSNRHFLLTDVSGNNIAVISKENVASPSEFNSKIEWAVREHFSAESAKIDRVGDDMKFSVATVEDSEDCSRDFILEEIVVY